MFPSPKIGDSQKIPSISRGAQWNVQHSVGKFFCKEKQNGYLVFQLPDCVPTTNKKEKICFKIFLIIISPSAYTVYTSKLLILHHKQYNMCFNT
jgi:hypothetical protein